MKRKILYVFGAEKASGAENVLLRLIESNLNNVSPHIFLAPGTFANMLKRDKVSVFGTYITTLNELRKLNRSTTGHLKFLLLAVANYIKISYKVIKYIRCHRIDVIHANTIAQGSYLIPAVIFCKVFLRKTCWIWSDHDLKYFSKSDNIFSTTNAFVYDLTLVVSNAVKSKYENKDSIQTLYNGINVDDFCADLALRSLGRSELAISDTTVVVGIAATLIRRKGVLELVNVFKEIAMSFPDIKLFVAGHLSNDEPEYGEKFLKEIKDIKEIQYLGPVSDMRQFYNVVDIVINNSSLLGSEPLGTTILEAMAFEKLTVASKTGGSPEIIDDEVNGFLFEADNFNELKALLTNIILDFSSGKYEQITRNARQKIYTNFHIDVMVKEYNKIIAELS